MEISKIRVARKAAQECFWGDYELNAHDILKRLAQNDAGFDRFLFSKIMENATYPSWMIRALFGSGKWQPLLDRYMKKGNHNKRVRLIAANLTGNFDLAREYGWNV